MNSWLVHPRYFSAYAAAAGIVASDPDLPKGTHLRLFPSAALGFPLAPFLVWPVEAFSTDMPAMDWFARDGRPQPGLGLDAAGGVLIGRRQPEVPSDSRLAGVEARFQGTGELALLDRSGGRVIAARSAVRWLVAAPQITGLRLRGRGRVTLQGWVISAGRAIEALLNQPPFASLSLPVDGDQPWYAGGEGPAAALARAEQGAPRRWTRPDRPDGPFDALPASAERARVAAFQADLDDDALRLVSDATRPPSLVQRPHLWPAEVSADGKRRPWQRATEWVQGSLLMKALDVGAGRYLGTAALLDDLLVPADPFQAPGARGWLAAGLFAVGPAMRFELPDPDAMELRLIERLMQLQPGLRRPAELAVQRHGLTLRAFVATALAAPPPDLPAAPQVLLGDAGWQREDEGPSTRFRQQLRITTPPLATLVALGRLEADGWRTRHDAVDLTTATPDADPAQRAAPRMLGNTETLADGGYGIVPDSDIAADGAPWTYRVALADVFGRFGAAADIVVPTPPRPPVPQPVLRSHLELAEWAAGDAPAVAGSVRWTVAVPALHEMTAGSRPLARVVIDFDGALQDALAPQDGGLLHFDFGLPALLPMESRALTATANFEDDEGTPGPTVALTIAIHDPRSPPVPQTGIAIVWSSRPAPATDVEFRLRFTGVPGARYRAYLADARGLDIALMDGERPRTRAEVAVDGAQQGLAGLGLRDRFRLLTDTPLQPGGDGRVLFDTRLPRALETVQFLRFVPLSSQGNEAAFESCPLLPVAVPSDRRPPAPRVQTRVDPVSGVATVTVTALGLDLVALRAAEPGLFNEPPADDAQPPEYRLRRASGGVPDALYAREIGRGVLQRDGDQFSAAVDDSPTPEGLSAYVRYHYWAEVRMPPERRLPPGVDEIALPAGAIEPLQPAQRQNAPGAFSSASAPAMALFLPAAVPLLPDGSVTATVGAGAAAGSWRLTLAIRGGPVAHPRAVGGFTVQLHLKLDDGNWTPEADPVALESGALDLVIERAEPAVPPVPVLQLALVLVDPVGREAPPLRMEATPV
ncbi:hypothetical protein ACS5PN_05445 [Roseateles sp. NT4]|uniref:hypothetical protein n=1 Tax=Roseateles sp. NT4 TaxID=3453715 RepID=UPI003EEC00F6